MLFVSGEALGAIGDVSVIPVLQEYSKDSVPEVAETCELALHRLEWLKSNDSSTNLDKSPYMSVDPAPPTEINDVDKLEDILLNENFSLFERYRAMFSLRNICTPESVLALSKGEYSSYFTSSLFNHTKMFLYFINRFKGRQCLIQTRNSFCSRAVARGNLSTIFASFFGRQRRK